MMHIVRLLSFIIMMTCATSAFALAPCGDTVVDTAGVLTNESELERAAIALEKATGAIVRVRVSKNFVPDDTLYAHAVAVANGECASWGNGRGEVRSNLIIIWFADSVGDIGFYFGDRWDSRLRVWEGGNDSTNEDLVVDAMVPSLEAGDVDSAMSLGLAKLTDILTTKPTTPKAKEPETPLVSDPAPPASTTVVVPTVKNEPLINLRTFLLLLGGFILIVASLVAARTAMRERAEERRKEEARQTARLAALAVLNEAVDANNQADKAAERVEAAITAAEEVSSSEHIVQWRAQLRELKGQAETLREALNAPTNPRENQWPLAAYNDARAAFEEQLPKHQSVRDEIMKLAETTENIPALAKAMPEALNDLQFKTVASVGQLIANIGRDGLITTIPDGILRDGEAVVGQMRNAIEARDWGLASSLLVKARMEFGRAETAANGLKLRRNKATERLAALRQALETYPERKETADKAVTLLARKYTPDSYPLVADNATKADGLYKKLEGGLPTLEKLLASQAWDEVEEQLELAEDAWDDIDDLLMAVTDRLMRLDEMVQDADAEVAEADRSIKAAVVYLADHPKYDTAANQAAVKQLQSDLDQVPSQKKGKPLPVVKRLRQATAIDDAADAFLVEIEARVADDAARAARAKRLLSDIGTRIGEYNRYAMLHRGDIPSTTVDILKQALTDYGQLGRVRDVDEQLAAGTTLGQLLDTFHTAAKQAVSAAEAERKRVREAEEAEAAAAAAAIEQAAKAARRRKVDNGPSIGMEGFSFGNGRPTRSVYSNTGGLSGPTRSVGFSSLGGGTRSVGGGLSGTTRRIGR